VQKFFFDKKMEFEVTFVRIFEKKDEDGNYEFLLDIPLGC